MMLNCYLQCVSSRSCKDGRLTPVQNGFFGKGVLSRSTPDFIERQQRDHLGTTDGKAFHRRKRKREEATTQQPSSSTENEDVESLKRRKNNEEKPIADRQTVVAASDVPNPSLAATPLPSLVVEPLQLGLDEAVFLMLAIGCLRVKKPNDTGEMPLPELWACARSLLNNFIPKYAGMPKVRGTCFILTYLIRTAYHYYRSEGWVVKSGLKMAVDYVLYNGSPDAQHSMYALY